MLPIALWLGLLWSPAFPVFVTPGMTQEQVRAILGDPTTFVFTGSVNSDDTSDWYTDRGVLVNYTKGVVKSVSITRR